MFIDRGNQGVGGNPFQFVILQVAHVFAVPIRHHCPQIIGIPAFHILDGDGCGNGFIGYAVIPGGNLMGQIDLIEGLLRGNGDVLINGVLLVRRSPGIGHLNCGGAVVTGKGGSAVRGNVAVEDVGGVLNDLERVTAALGQLRQVRSVALQAEIQLLGVDVALRSVVDHVLHIFRTHGVGNIGGYFRFLCPGCGDVEVYIVTGCVSACAQSPVRIIVDICIPILIVLSVREIQGVITVSPCPGCILGERKCIACLTII